MKWRGIHELRPETESRNGGDHELWNHEMRGFPVIHTDPGCKILGKNCFSGKIASK